MEYEVSASLAYITTGRMGNGPEYVYNVILIDGRRVSDNLRRVVARIENQKTGTEYLLGAFTSQRRAIEGVYRQINGMFNSNDLSEIPASMLNQIGLETSAQPYQPTDEDAPWRESIVTTHASRRDGRPLRRVSVDGVDTGLYLESDHGWFYVVVFYADLDPQDTGNYQSCGYRTRREALDRIVADHISGAWTNNFARGHA